MDHDRALAALAADDPRLRRLIAEYSEEGAAAIERFMTEEPAAAVRFMAAVVSLSDDGPVDH